MTSFRKDYGTKETTCIEQNRQRKGQLCRVKTDMVIKGDNLVIEGDNLKTKSQERNEQRRRKAL